MVDRSNKAGRPVRVRLFAFALLLSALVMPAGPALAGEGIADERKERLVHLLRHECGSCHGLKMLGGLGPALTPAAIHARSDEYLLETILEGVAGTPMPPWRSIVTPEEAAWLVEQLREGVVK